MIPVYSTDMPGKSQNLDWMWAFLNKGHSVTNDEERMAAILMAQYRDVCSTPRKNISDCEYRQELIGEISKHNTTWPEISPRNPDLNKSVRKIVRDPEIEDVFVDVEGVKEALKR